MLHINNIASNRYRLNSSTSSQNEFYIREPSLGSGRDQYINSPINSGRDTTNAISSRSNASIRMEKSLDNTATIRFINEDSNPNDQSNRYSFESGAEALSESGYGVISCSNSRSGSFSVSGLSSSVDMLRPSAINANIGVTDDTLYLNTSSSSSYNISESELRSFSGSSILPRVPSLLSGDNSKFNANFSSSSSFDQQGINSALSSPTEMQLLSPSKHFQSFDFIGNDSLPLEVSKQLLGHIHSDNHDITHREQFVDNNQVTGTNDKDLDINAVVKNLDSQTNQASQVVSESINPVDVKDVIPTNHDAVVSSALSSTHSSLTTNTHERSSQSSDSENKQEIDDTKGYFEKPSHTSSHTILEFDDCMYNHNIDSKHVNNLYRVLKRFHGEESASEQSKTFPFPSPTSRPSSLRITSNKLSKLFESILKPSLFHTFEVSNHSLSTSYSKVEGYRSTNSDTTNASSSSLNTNHISGSSPAISSNVSIAEPSISSSIPSLSLPSISEVSFGVEEPINGSPKDDEWMRKYLQLIVTTLQSSPSFMHSKRSKVSPIHSPIQLSQLSSFDKPLASKQHNTGSYAVSSTGHSHSVSSNASSKCEINLDILCLIFLIYSLAQIADKLALSNPAVQSTTSDQHHHSVSSHTLQFTPFQWIAARIFGAKNNRDNVGTHHSEINVDDFDISSTFEVSGSGNSAYLSSTHSIFDNDLSSSNISGIPGSRRNSVSYSNYPSSTFKHSNSLLYSQSSECDNSPKSANVLNSEISNVSTSLETISQQQLLSSGSKISVAKSLYLQEKRDLMSLLMTTLTALDLHTNGEVTKELLFQITSYTIEEMDENQFDRDN